MCIGRYVTLAAAILGLLLSMLLAGCAGPSPRLQEAQSEYRGLAEEGRYQEAVAPARRALALAEDEFGRDDTALAALMNEVADLYLRAGRMNEAGELYRSALAIEEQAFGRDAPALAGTLNDLAGWYEAEARYPEAEATYRRVLSIRESELGLEHPGLVPVLDDVARVYRDRGRYADAESLYKRALRLVERAYGADHPRVARRLDYLAGLYEMMGREQAARPYRARALRIAEDASETPAAPKEDAGLDLTDLARRYRRVGEYQKAEGLLKRSVGRAEAHYGPRHHRVARRLVDLVQLYSEQGRLGEAEALMKRALAIEEQTFGPKHLRICYDLGWLAHVYNAQGNCAAAERLHQRCLAILNEGRGDTHPAAARELSALAVLDYCQTRYGEALEHIRKATAIYRGNPELVAGGPYRGGRPGNAAVRETFLTHLAIIQRQPERTPELVAESFEVGQLARAREAARTGVRTAARFREGQDELARIVRAREDAVDQWRALDAQLAEAVSALPDKRDAQREHELREALGSLKARLDELDTQLERRFPRYHELTDPEPLSLEEIQSLLRPDEALVSYLIGGDKSYLWVVRKDKAAMHPLSLGKGELDMRVQTLRSRLDLSGVERLEDVPPFPVGAAYELYEIMFASADSLLDGIRHLIIVPDGALESLPFSVLITRPPRGSVRDFHDYRGVAWLAEKYATTVLPSVSLLRTLRRFASGASAPRPFAGFGDPALAGSRQARRLNVAALFTRGAIANVDAVRRLPRLPETAQEVNAVAELLGGDKEVVFVGTSATERRVKEMDLRPYRVLMFSTHGLMAGEFEGLAEPALVLTPPEQGTAEDDGLLTASEIARLELNADWVILSACNTAAADGTPGAEGLSGLARAFFYAGSRALLVSHWAISSEATVALTTRMFATLAENPGLTRAQALRRAMLALLHDEQKPYLAHPTFWAPFVVVGEGARA